jgi:hypothetical protein
MRMAPTTGRMKGPRMRRPMRAVHRPKVAKGVAVDDVVVDVAIGRPAA